MATYIQGLDITLPEGVYDFVVADANDKRSQGGNEMIELQLIIKGPDGQESKVYDNLVFTPKAFWKIDTFRLCTGDKLVKGQSVEFDATDCLDRTGKCYVIVDKYEGRERNKVSEYLDPAVIKDSQSPQQAVKPQPSAASATSPADDEIPM
jgi:Protein of unknown function (DUF669)